MLRIVLVWVALVLTGADASPCNQSEQASTTGLFRSAAQRAGCAPYATSAADGGVAINWTCATTTCTPTMLQLAVQLPNCETLSDGTNRKTLLESSLYAECEFCTPDQRKEMDVLWKTAAQTSACSMYASSGGASFSWPCAATSCTAAIKALANSMPSCILDKQNERTRILNSITACTHTTVSTRAPAPGSPSASAPAWTAPWLVVVLLAFAVDA